MKILVNFYKFLKQKWIYLQVSLLCFFIIACMSTVFRSVYDSHVQDLSLGATAPSIRHWMGTDILGRDLLGRMLYGGRISFTVAALATFIAVIVGVPYGMFSGYKGGVVDRWCMGLVDILYALPYVIFVIVLRVFLGRGFISLFIAIGAIEWLMMARIVRAQVLTIKHRSFVEASKVLGQGPLNIVRLHILSNLKTTILSCITLIIPSIMLLEAFLSFLGVGVQAPDASLGSLIHEGMSHLDRYPWLVLFPIGCFSWIIFSCNLIGDWVREKLDTTL